MFMKAQRVPVYKAGPQSILATFNIKIGLLELPAPGLRVHSGSRVSGGVTQGRLRNVLS